MRRSIQVCVVAAAALAPLACGAVTAWVADAPAAHVVGVAPPRRPDIVLITIDALRADHLSVNGYKRLTTPAIDVFARGAVTFTQAIAQAPYTKASIASLMTGLYPSVHGTVTGSVPFPEAMTGHLQTTPLATDVLPSRLTTLAEALHEAGYRTVGLTANPFLSEWFGFNQGFERFTFFAGPDFLDGQRLVDAALDAAAGERSRPLFLWVHLMEPHSPYAPPPFTARAFALDGPIQPIAPDLEIPFWLVPGQPRDLREYVVRYDEEIAAVDVDVDVLLRGLRELRDSSNMVVVLTADHGEQFLDHGGWEHSTTLYDELIRVPLVIDAPGLAPRNLDTQVQLVDLYPTLLALAGLQMPGCVSGTSLSSVLAGAAGAEPEARPAFAEIAGSQRAVRSRGWKLTVFNDGRRQLFDLEHDPGERTNVADAEPTKLIELRRELDRILALAQGHQTAAETGRIDPTILQRLRSLGYSAR
jgi:arylsulfatase A-like enzyme